MYDTAPFTPFRGETKQFLHVDIDNKTLESLFDLHPSLENSFDLSEFVSGAAAAIVGGGDQCVAASVSTALSGVPDSSVVTSAVASSADLVTLSSAATSQHLAEIERQLGPGPVHSSTARYVQQQHSPNSVVPTAASPVAHPLQNQHHLNHHQQQHHLRQQQHHLQGYQSVLSPSLTVEEVSQAFSDDSCVFLPEYDLPISTTTTSTSVASTVNGRWGTGPEPFYPTVKREDLGLASLTACSLEANLPGFTAAASSSSMSTITNSATPISIDMKMEYDTGDGLGVRVGGCYSGSVTATVLSPSRSSRTLSESSTATTSTMPDSPRRLSKGGSKRRHVPKGSEEYKEKRARNNVAVRKSRAKAKEKQRLTEHRVKDLLDANEALTKKVEMLTKELTVLRGLFVNVGAQLPDDFSKLLEQS